MGFGLTSLAFDEFLARVAQSHEVWGPARMPRCGRHSAQEVIGYRPVASLADLVLDRKSFFSPKEAVFPIRETLLEFRSNETLEPDLPCRSKLLFLRACDIHALDRLDCIFLHNGQVPDLTYEHRRKRMKLILVECPGRGFDSCFCVSMGTSRADDYAMAIRIVDEKVLVHVRDEALLPLLDGFTGNVDFTPVPVQENSTVVAVPAVDQVTSKLFDDPLWREYTKRCIACGRCNTSCPTCSCFNLQDVPPHGDRPGVRRRTWTGCHLDGFTTMAGGHDFRREHGDRMRFKTMHKINDFHRRFGRHMCVGCGRCDDVCPEYISFSRCVNRLAELIRDASGEVKVGATPFPEPGGAP